MVLKKGPECRGGRKTKQCFTICLIANVYGGREVASVILKSRKPRCFKGIDVSKLPVNPFVAIIPYCKLTLLVPIPLASKQPKNTRGYLNVCCDSVEKSLACTSTFTANLKEFSQQKSLSL